MALLGVPSLEGLQAPIATKVSSAVLKTAIGSVAGSGLVSGGAS